MADEQSRRTNAIQVAYNEAHAEFMKAQLLIAERLPELTLEELAEYQRIDAEIIAHQAEQQKQQQELFALRQKASTAEEKFEYVGRLLAVIERILNSCIIKLRNWLTSFAVVLRKKNPENERPNPCKSGPFIDARDAPISWL